MDILEQHGYNPAKFYLGRLCKRGHDWNNTGKSLRRKRPKLKTKTGGDCLECSNLRVKEFVSRNPHKPSEYIKRFYEKHPHKVLERNQKAISWDKRNRERKNAALKLWRKNNREKVREQKRRHRQRHPEENMKSLNRRRSRRLKAHRFPYSYTQMQSRSAQFDGMCAYCGDRQHSHWDHFIPLSKGGSDVLGNLVPACEFCNCSKHDKDPLEWYKRQEFYSDRRWRKILKILGKSETGYAQIPLL